MCNEPESALYSVSEKGHVREHPVWNELIFGVCHSECLTRSEKAVTNRK